MAWSSCSSISYDSSEDLTSDPDDPGQDGRNGDHETTSKAIPLDKHQTPQSTSKPVPHRELGISGQNPGVPDRNLGVPAKRKLGNPSANIPKKRPTMSTEKKCDDEVAIEPLTEALLQLDYLTQKVGEVSELVEPLGDRLLAKVDAGFQDIEDGLLQLETFIRKTFKVPDGNQGNFETFEEAVRYLDPAHPDHILRKETLSNTILEEMEMKGSQSAAIRAILETLFHKNLIRESFWTFQSDKEKFSHKSLCVPQVLRSFILSLISRFPREKELCFQWRAGIVEYQLRGIFVRTKKTNTSTEGNEFWWNFH